MALTADDIAGRIRRAVEASAMTQHAVAEAVGMDPTALSKALAGKRNFSTTEVALLCDALHVSPLRLLTDENAEIVNPATTAATARIRQMVELDAFLTEVGFPRQGRSYPATLLDRAVEAYLAGQVSIRPIASLIGTDADDLLDELQATPRAGAT